MLQDRLAGSSLRARCGFLSFDVRVILHLSGVLKLGLRGHFVAVEMLVMCDLRIELSKITTAKSVRLRG